MVIHKCDKCGAIMARWIKLDVSVDALNPNLNINDIYKYHLDKYELCDYCYKEFVDGLYKD